MVSICMPPMPGLERGPPTWISGAASDICAGRPPCCPSARPASSAAAADGSCSAEGVLRWAAPHAAAGTVNDGVVRPANYHSGRVNIQAALLMSEQSA